MDQTLELDEQQFEQIESILDDELISLGVHTVLLIDLAGNAIVDLDAGESNIDIYSLAALSAGNFGAVNEMAAMIGEKDFSLLLHKGKTKSIHFSKVNEDLLLVIIFGNDVSLGFLRLKVAEVINKIHDLT